MEKSKYSQLCSLNKINEKSDFEIESILQARYGESIALWIMARMPEQSSNNRFIA